MHGQVVELVPRQAGFKARCQGPDALVALIKGWLKAAKNRCHRQVKLAVAKQGVRIDEGWRPRAGKQEVAGPKIAV